MIHHFHEENAALTKSSDMGSASITSSIMDYEFENGRRYHAYKAGRKYSSGRHSHQSHHVLIKYARLSMAQR